MEWQVRIEGHPKQRVLVTFDPQGEMIIFHGQYSIKNHWVDFSTETHPMEIDLETIQSLIGKVYDIMNKRLEVYEDLDKSFGVIKEIKIEGEELVPIPLLATTPFTGVPELLLTSGALVFPPNEPPVLDYLLTTCFFLNKYLESTC